MAKAKAPAKKPASKRAAKPAVKKAPAKKKKPAKEIVMKNASMTLIASKSDLCKASDLPPGTPVIPLNQTSVHQSKLNAILKKIDAELPDAATVAAVLQQPLPNVV